MSTRHCLLLGLLVLPLTTLAGEEARPAAPSLDLKNQNIQKIVQASAAAQPAAEVKAAAKQEPLLALTYRSSRRVHRTECDSMQCVAYAADGSVLFSLPREQVFGPERGDRDGWLSCQQVDDMLSTFERYDKCRGITIGLPSRGTDAPPPLPGTRPVPTN